MPLVTLLGQVLTQRNRGSKGEPQAEETHQRETVPSPGYLLGQARKPGRGGEGKEPDHGGKARRRTEGRPKPAGRGGNRIEPAQPSRTPTVNRLTWQRLFRLSMFNRFWSPETSTTYMAPLKMSIW